MTSKKCVVYFISVCVGNEIYVQMRFGSDNSSTILLLSSVLKGTVSYNLKYAMTCCVIEGGGQ